MKWLLKITPFPLSLKSFGGLILALVSVMMFAGCTDDDEENKQENPLPVTSIVGSLNVTVNPPSSALTVTGPESYKQEFTGNKFLANLKPGDYTAKATAAGFVDGSASINVVAGETSALQLILKPNDIISQAPRAVYRDDGGSLIPLDADKMESGEFFFYAWLEDEVQGIFPEKVGSFVEPGKPTLSEQDEFAPSFTQNLGGAWVGFRDSNGIVRPIIGADVRWEIDQQWSGRVNSTQFGTSDDNRSGLGFGVNDDQADTRTNNSRLTTERFPLLVSEYPLFNQVGVGTPYTDGFTWVTFFSPDRNASARIVAVATINGEEVGKQILHKNFIPQPKIEITKTVDHSVVNLVDGTAMATWTVTVKNVGTGDASRVDLNDFLLSGDGATYALSGLPAGSVAVGNDGFTYSFPLASDFDGVPSQTDQLLGDAQSLAVLGASGVTNTGLSVVNGDVGVSQGTPVTGFPEGVVLNGSIHNNDSVAQAAQSALTVAYNALDERACTGSLNTPLSDATLTPGVYCYDSSASLTGPLVLDAQGNPAAEFVFKIESTLTTAEGASISLINGANPCNVYWNVGSSATLGTGSFFSGNILAQASITAGTNASISGRALARTGAVTLDTNAINAPLSCVESTGNSETLTFQATVTEPGTYCNEVEVVSYSSETQEWTPADLNAQACFTALESNLSIIKDFVADNNTTSLGDALTVSANVPATLRVRVINSGTGTATGVAVSDVLSSGDAELYELISVSSGTPNANDGFDTVIGDIAAGEEVTLLFAVKASADGVYCDTVTVSATSGTIGIGSDDACLTVATPNLTITKDDAPGTVYPGSNYTSTIVVSNTGSATARNVVISDLLGRNAAEDVWVVYMSSNFNNAGGTLVGNTVTAPSAIDIQVDESVTITVVSRIPARAPSGSYCDTATVTSSNALSKNASDCVTVPAFSALQTQLVDSVDPIEAGDQVTYSSVLSVEELSNEGVVSSELTYSFGLVNPTILGIPGVFEVQSTIIYLDSNPIRDPITGLVLSDISNPTAVLLAEGSDYTVDNSTLGFQELVMSPNVALEPGHALYVQHVVLVPIGTPGNRLYTTSYIWTSVGSVDPTHIYEASSSEPTNVLP